MSAVFNASYWRMAEALAIQLNFSGDGVGSLTSAADAPE
jgi:hypothetical protein